MKLTQGQRDLVGNYDWIKSTVPVEHPMAEKHKARESALDSWVIVCSWFGKDFWKNQGNG